MGERLPPPLCRRHELLVSTDLVPSSLIIWLWRVGEDSGKIEFLTNFYWLLENNDSWYRMLSFKSEGKPSANQYALSMLLQVYRE